MQSVTTSLEKSPTAPTSARALIQCGLGTFVPSIQTRWPKGAEHHTGISLIWFEETIDFHLTAVSIEAETAPNGPMRPTQPAQSGI